MPSQRLIQDEKIIHKALEQTCCKSNCLSHLSAAQVGMLCAGYCALQSRAAQTEHIKHLARDFQHLSEKDSRLQPQLVLPNSAPIPVCQNAFCIVYGMGQCGLTLTTLKKYVKERFAPEVIKSRKPRPKPMFDFCAEFFALLSS
eukprot:g17665.t1